MSVYLGVDFHARTQTVCWCDTADGLIHEIMGFCCTGQLDWLVSSLTN